MINNKINNDKKFNVDSYGSVTTKVVQTVEHHVSYEFIWIRRTCDYI